MLQELPVQVAQVLEVSLWQQEAADSLRVLQAEEEAYLLQVLQELPVQVTQVLEISLWQQEATDLLRMLLSLNWRTLVVTVCCDPEHLADVSES